MPQTYTTTDTFATPFQTMADSDPADGNSVRAPIEDLADRTHYLNARLNNAVGEYTYHEGLRSRAIERGPEEGFASAASSGVSDFYLNLEGGVPCLVARVDSGFVCFQTKIPQGCVIQQIAVLCQETSSRTETNRWGVEVFSRSLNFAVAEAPSSTQIGTTVYAGSGTGYKRILLSSLAYTVTATDVVFVRVRGPSGALAANDKLYGIRITFDDIGPRNDG